MQIKHSFTQSLFSILILLTLTFATVNPLTVHAQGGGGIQRKVNPQTGKVSFLLPEAGSLVPAHEALADVPAAERRADPGMALAKRFGAEFGLRDPERELAEMQVRQFDNGRINVRYRQVYRGIPVLGGELIVHTNEEAIGEGTQPFKVGTQRCCGLLKTKALLDALQAGNFDAAIGGARRDEERSRAKERIFSVRDPNGQWDPKRQRPELWNLLNGRIRPGESIRVFPLSNWTEIDIWQYIHVENIPIVPLYYAKEREVIVRGNSLIVQEQPFVVTMPGEKPQVLKCRMRSLGCSPCTGAIRSDADTLPKIINELIATKQSERLLRIIDHDQDGSMEVKKREGYF